MTNRSIKGGKKIPAPSCKMCGECCRWMGFIIQMNKARKEYYETRGCQIVGNMVLVYSPCLHLTSDNKCDIYDDRPWQCRHWYGARRGYWTPEGCVFNPNNKISKK